MNKFHKAALSVVAATALLPGLANAGVDWQYNWADAFLADGATKPATLPPDLSPPVDQLKYTSEAVVVFDDNDTSGSITPGDTFTDYVFVRIDQFFNNVVSVPDPRYGQGQGLIDIGGGNFLNLLGNHEITLKIKLTGTQQTPVSYSVDAIDLMDWYFDAGTDTGTGAGQSVTGYTAADFSNLSTFEDGVIVETSDFLGGGGVNALNIPDGALRLIVTMDDVLSTLDPSYGDFEQFSELGLDITTILGTADSNNDRCQGPSGGDADCQSSPASILAAFGAPAPGANQFAFHTQSDGSFLKELSVPEPSTLALLGLAAVGFGYTYRRKPASA